jgi:arylsulfatase A-like enzyme
MIVADDLGWNDVGYHGSEIKTPNIDRIAREGLELDHYYAQPTCSPTRAALMTGKSPRRLGVDFPISKNAPGGLPMSERLLPERLADEGYQSLMVGKWHLGHFEKRYFPHRRGFEKFYGHVTGGIGYWDHVHGGGLDWQRDGVTLREDGYTTHLFTDEAVRLLAQRDRSRPTFLYLAYNAPHTPNEAPEATIESYASIENPNRRLHAAMVSELDSEIGRVLAAIDAEGMRDETIVLFLSDNGGLNTNSFPPGMVRLMNGLGSVFGEPLPSASLEWMRGNVLNGGSDNAPLRGGKSLITEGGVRVPGAIWWPGRLEKRRIDGRFTVQDVLPTLLEAIGRGAAIPTDLDGASRWRMLLGEEDGADAPDYLIGGFDGSALYRGPWKLMLPSSPVPFGDTTPRLYRIAEDPTEDRDLAADHPDVVAELTATIEGWPRGPQFQSSPFAIFRDPDTFGGEEDREPWADVAR